MLTSNFNAVLSYAFGILCCLTLAKAGNLRWIFGVLYLIGSDVLEFWTGRLDDELCVVLFSWELLCHPSVGASNELISLSSIYLKDN